MSLQRELEETRKEAERYKKALKEKVCGKAPNSDSEFHLLRRGPYRTW